MSLTSVLDNKEVKNHFKQLPPLKPYFRSFVEGKEPFSKKEGEKGLLVPPIAGFSSGIDGGTVGTAYDYWFRTHLQRINNIHVEKVMPSQVEDGLFQLSKRNILSKKEMVRLEDDIKKTLRIKDDYISGAEVDLKELSDGLMQLAYCEQVSRVARNAPQYIRESGYFKQDKIETVELINLIEKTKEFSYEKYFKMNNEIHFNPTFGLASSFVDGADADFIIDDTLVDIKTTTGKDYGCLSKNNNQLLGYYMLNDYEGFYAIDKLALFFPRQNQFVYFDMNEYKKAFDYEAFKKKFYELVFL